MCTAQRAGSHVSPRTTAGTSQASRGKQQGINLRKICLEGSCAGLRVGFCVPCGSSPTQNILQFCAFMRGQSSHTLELAASSTFTCGCTKRYHLSLQTSLDTKAGGHSDLWVPDRPHPAATLLWHGLCAAVPTQCVTLGHSQGTL